MSSGLVRLRWGITFLLFALLGLCGFVVTSRIVAPLQTENMILKAELAQQRQSSKRLLERLDSLEEDYSDLLIREAKPTNNILLIGHRGGGVTLAPENTLAALSNGELWGYEVDLRTTKDGDVVLMHDETVDRTTNGFGKLNALSTNDVRLLDAGAWKGANFTGQKVPFLREALELIKKSDAMAYLDIKDAKVDAVRSVVDTCQFPEKNLVFLTFGDQQAAEYVNNFPQAAVYRSLWGEVYQGGGTDRLLSSFAAAGVKGVTVRADQLSQEYVEAVHRVGLKVAVVTRVVESKGQLNYYFIWGVDELWLDDLDSVVSERNQGDGVLRVAH